VQNFVASLFNGSTSAKETKRLVDKTYSVKALRMRAIYKIFLKQIKADKNTDDKGSLL
jgi:hypothetical protein